MFQLSLLTQCLHLSVYITIPVSLCLEMASTSAAIIGLLETKRLWVSFLDFSLSLQNNRRISTSEHGTVPLGKPGGVDQHEF